METMFHRERPSLRDRLLNHALRLPIDGALSSDALREWERYLDATERRLAQAQRDDHTPAIRDYPGPGDSTHARLLAGEILIEEVSAGPGREQAARDAFVEHYRGAALLRHARLPALVSRLRERPTPALPPEETVRLHVAAEADPAMQLLVRMSVVEVYPVIYDAVFEVSVRQQGQARASIRALATTVEELGVPLARRGADRRYRGSLWRLGAYWRFDTAPDGVLAECEWLALRRRHPWPIRPLAGAWGRALAPRTLHRLLATLRREAPLITWST